VKVSKAVRGVLDKAIAEKAIAIWIHDLHRGEHFDHPLGKQLDKLPETFMYRGHMLTFRTYGAGCDCKRTYLEARKRKPIPVVE
jgi:hypothetical protein